MITFPNSKINIGLNIVEKRVDGYHNLETVFYPIPLQDALEIVPAPAQENGFRFTASGVDIEGDPLPINCLLLIFICIKTSPPAPD